MIILVVIPFSRVFMAIIFLEISSTVTDLKQLREFFSCLILRILKWSITNEMEKFSMTLRLEKIRALDSIVQSVITQGKEYL